MIKQALITISIDIAPQQVPVRATTHTVCVFGLGDAKNDQALLGPMRPEGIRLMIHH